MNERVADLHEGWATDLFDVFCECGRAWCAERVTVSSAMYEELRRVPTHFLVKTGHVDRADRIVGEYDGFVVRDARSPA